MRGGKMHEGVVLLGCLAVWLTGCASTPRLPDTGSVSGSPVVWLNPLGKTPPAVLGGTVRMDAFEELLFRSGLEHVSELPPRSAPLRRQEADRLFALLLRKTVTLASFPPRMASSFLLREVLAGGDISREELLQRVARFDQVAVLRPDGYLAWALDGRTQQRVGTVEWKEETPRAGVFELGRFYHASGGVFRQADIPLRPNPSGPVLAEVYDDADVINRTLDGTQEAFVGLLQATGRLLLHPVDSLVALRHLPSAIASLIASSPEYCRRFRYMTRGEQLEAISKLTVELLVAWGTVRALPPSVPLTELSEGVLPPVLSLSADGALVMERVAAPLGLVTGVSSGVPGAAIILSHMSARGGGDDTRVSGKELEALRGEFEAVKSRFWKHAAQQEPGSYSADNLARMRQGKPPVGSDGFPMELHHKTPLAEGGTNAFENLIPLTRTEHRLGPNYKLNHPNLP